MWSPLSPRRLRHVSPAVSLLLAAACLSACSTSPTFRPATPLPDGRTFEVGAGVGGVGSIDRYGAQSTGWGRVALADAVDLFGSVHGTGALGLGGVGLDQSGALAVGDLSLGYGGYAFGGTVGGRFRYPVLDGLYIGVGAQLDYLQQNFYGIDERFVTGMVTLPVSERFYEDISVYVRPSVGVALPLYPEAQMPFFGVFEMPLGLTWQATDWLMVLGEGGYHLPTSGAYLSLGLAAHF